MKTPLSGRPDRSRMEPLWDRVDRNRYLLVFYLAIFALLGGVWFGVLYVLVSGMVVLLSANLVVARVLLGVSLEAWVVHAFAVGVAVTLLLEWGTLARSEKMLLKRLGATLAPTGVHLDAKMAVKDMALASGVNPAPAFFVLDCENVNALALHPLGRRPSIAVSQGMLDKLSVGQQRAVYANLLARVANGDIRLATAVAAIGAPLHEWRAARRARSNELMDRELTGAPVSEKVAGDALLPLLVLGPVIILATEIVVALYRRSQLKAAEKADAEGMLLLKDPHEMLSALERCVWLDNVVLKGGEAFGQLFYCWPGDSTNDETDPEWERVARLREVLGVEGAVELRA